MDSDAVQMVAVNGKELVFEGVVARGDVRGLCLEMSVEQRFRNPGEESVEVVYTFPLPWRAMLLGVEVLLGDKRLTGCVLEKSYAAEKYEDTVADGNAAIMLERNHDESYTLNLGNLAAKERCVVTLRYAQTLAFEQGGLRLLIPTTIAPRYGDMISEGGLQPHQVATHDLMAEYDFGVTLNLHGALSRARIASPSHPIAVLTKVELATVSLGRQSQLDRDFILVLDQLEQDSTAVMANDFVEPGAVAVMASFNVHLPEGKSQSVALKVLVDCSGSMAGDSMLAAKRSLHAMIEQLGAGDRFSVSRFGSNVEHRGRALWKATDATKNAGHRWVDALDADMGGTAMQKALKSTFDLGHTGPCDVLLITDGEISGIDTTIAAAKASSHRLFVVGIGSSPAESHLRRLAAETGGACDFVAPGEAVEPAAERMFNRLHSIRLDQVQVEWPGGQKPDWESPVSRSAFDGDSVTVFAQFVQALVGNVRLLGQPNQAPGLVCVGSAEVSAAVTDGGTVSRMAAWVQADALGQAKGRGGSVARKQARSLAVRYQLVTDQTNFLLTLEREADQRASDMPQLHKVPQMMAAGHSGMGSVRESHRVAAYCMNIDPPDWHAAMLEPQSVSPLQVSDNISDAASQTSAGSVQHTWLGTVRLVEPEAEATPVVAQTIDTPDYCGLSPLGLLQTLDAESIESWPRTYAALKKLNLGQALLDWLELVLGESDEESDVVAAFLASVIRQEFDSVSAPEPEAQSLGCNQLSLVQERLSRLLEERGVNVDVSLQEKIQGQLLTLDAGNWNVGVFSSLAELEDR